MKKIIKIKKIPTDRLYVFFAMLQEPPIFLFSD